MNITIVGVGALGSHLVPLLRNVKAAVTVVDFDHIDSGNVHSQFHAKSHIGKSKVVALAQTVDFLWGYKIAKNSNRVQRNNVQSILGDAGLVIDCLDNGESRRVVQDFVRWLQRPCLHGAVDANGTIGRICWDAKFNIDDEDRVGAPTCENGEHLAFLSIVASHMAHAVKVFCANQTQISYQITPNGTIRI